MRMRRGLIAALAGLGLALVAGGGLGPAEAAPVLCQKKSGLIAIRDPACKKREIPLDLAQFGAAGPSLVAHTQNVESTFPIASSPTVVAVIGDIASATYSGSYSTALVHPETASYVVTNAHNRRVIGSFDLWELYHLINLRMSEGAQWDIKNVTGMLAKEISKYHPGLVAPALKRVK